MRQDTIAIIKPDAVRRRLIGTILDEIEKDEEITIISMRTMLATDRDGSKHIRWSPRDFYTFQHHGKPYLEDLIRFMCDGTSVLMQLQGEDVITRWREMMGRFKAPEDADEAETWLRTLRGRFMLEDCLPMENLVHGSDSAESFRHESNILRRFLF